jgi:hypothetical protein
VDADDLVARHREHPERVRVAEVVLAREREAAQVVDRRDVLRFRVREALAVERDVLLDVVDQRPKAVSLERPQPLARECLRFRLEHHRRILAWPEG